jgi:hypothetical protein
MSVRQSVQIEPSDKVCVVRIGPLTRSDPDAELHVVKNVDGEWTRVERLYIQGKKQFKLHDLEPGEYHVAVFGNKIAGVATTAGNDVPFPFNVFLEAPEDHAKDYLRTSIPTNVPVMPSVATAIKKALK